MANLVQKTEHILINTLTAKDFGAYNKDGNDTTTNIDDLLYKGSKHNAPYKIPGDKIKRKFFSKHRNPQKGSYLMELVAPEPCENCDFSTGLSIGFKKHWNGNVWDRNPHFRYINGFLPSVGAGSGGELNNDDKKALLEQMINSINGDKGNPAWATIVYVVTDNDTGNASDIDITVNGTTTTVTGVAGELADTINETSALAPYVVAYELEIDGGGGKRLIIVGKNDKEYFNVEETAAEEVTVDNFYLKLSEREYNKPMQIKWTEHEQDWKPVSRIFQWEVDYSDDINLDFYYDGLNTTWDTGTSAVVDANDIADDVNNVAAIELKTDAGSSFTTAKIGIFAYNFNVADLVVGDEDTEVPVMKYGNPQYGHLTGYDIHQIFPHVGDTQGTYPNLPDPDANYCQIHFEISDTLPDNTLPGASATVDNLKIVNFYIKESEVDKALWDATEMMNDDPDTTDYYLFDLLAELLGGGADKRPDYETNIFTPSLGDPPNLDVIDSIHQAGGNDWID
jgi:hypothetical protein